MTLPGRCSCSGALTVLPCTQPSTVNCELLQTLLPHACSLRIISFHESYETLRLHTAKLAAAGPGACDLLICDEVMHILDDLTS
jgi:hypothetical protein